jgi:hypothetical protein
MDGGKKIDVIVAIALLVAIAQANGANVTTLRKQRH